jgi:hypothetical protein
MKICIIRLREIEEKAMGENAYNKLGKNAYSPLPGSPGSHLLHQT